MARLYSDTEIAALLARAAERQRAAPADGPTTGLTLDEIERLAAEAGLDPAHVRAAAGEMGARPSVPAAVPGQHTRERWVDVPFSDVAWEEAVTSLRARHPGTNWAQYTAMGTLAPNGDLSRVGAAHEWRHVAWTGVTTTLTASPRGARTRLRLVVGDSVGWGERAVATVYAILPALVLAMVAGPVTHNLTGSGWATLLAFVVTLVGATALGVALGAPAVARRRQARAVGAADTLDTVAAVFEDAASYSTAETTDAQASGRVDFDAAVSERDDETSEAGREPEVGTSQRRREAS